MRCIANIERLSKILRAFLYSVSKFMLTNTKLLWAIDAR